MKNTFKSKLHIYVTSVFFSNMKLWNYRKQTKSFENFYKTPFEWWKVYILDLAFCKVSIRLKLWNCINDLIYEALICWMGKSFFEVSVENLYDLDWKLWTTNPKSVIIF